MASSTSGEYVGSTSSDARHCAYSSIACAARLSSLLRPIKNRHAVMMQPAAADPGGSRPASRCTASRSACVSPSADRARARPQTT
eukprot:scaffold5178_cov107-Isochrysis_galbana.AAC.2